VSASKLEAPELPEPADFNAWWDTLYARFDRHERHAARTAAMAAWEQRDLYWLDRLREAEADARRYRWLREQAQSFGATIDTPAEHTLVFLWQQGKREEASWSLDDAIDAKAKTE